MRVLVTGGTGFVGSHVARAALAAGHEVSLLARNIDKARTWFSQWPDAQPTYVQGDITDAASVNAAVQGAEAVVHCAAATPIKADSNQQIHSANVDGTRHVVEGALAAGVKSVVCLSSLTAIFNTDASKVTADAEPVGSSMPYGQSKVEGERYLRKLQAQGAPVAIVYPAAIIGPDDPALNDTFIALKYRLEQGFRIFTGAGMQHIDVRDLASLIVALAGNREAGRYLAPGHYHGWDEIAAIIEAVSGAQLNKIPVAGWKLRMVGRVMDIIRLFKTVDSPISAETMRYATLWPNIKNTEAFERYGITLRSNRESFADSLRWMIEAGHLDAADFPLLGESP